MVYRAYNYNHLGINNTNLTIHLVETHIVLEFRQ